jgi:hypothetical protein
MKRTYLSLALLCLAACGTQDGTPLRPDCLKLSLQNGGFSSVPPAKVSLFFAVDTCGGQPVSGLTADQFQLYEDGTAVSKFESQQRIQPRGERMRIFSVLLIDLSGSLLRSGQFPNLKKAAAAFIDQVFASDPTAHRVAIYAFDGRKDLTPVVGFTGDPALLKGGLDSLETVECSATSNSCAAFPDRRTCAGWRCVDDSTNLNGAVVQGIAAVEGGLSSSPDIALRKGALVIFTDGSDQAARVAEKDALAAVTAETAPSVFTVGMGGEIDTAALRAFGKDGFFPAERAENLVTAFAEVAGRLAAMAQRYYLLEYCSPKRSGIHKLRVEAALPQAGAGGTLTGSLSTDFNANEFGSGCYLAPVPP